MKSFNININGHEYTFYQMHHVGELYYSVAFQLAGKTEMFVMRKTKDNWQISGRELPQFVLLSEYQLSLAIANQERMQLV